MSHNLKLGLKFLNVTFIKDKKEVSLFLSLSLWEFLIEIFSRVSVAFLYPIYLLQCGKLKNVKNKYKIYNNGCVSDYN